MGGEGRSLGILTTDLKHDALKHDALAMNRAVTVDDFDAARFWAASIETKAARAGLAEVQTAARRILLYLGPPDTSPTPGFGKAMLNLADLLIGLDDGPGTDGSS